jgi:hypothetical protein
MARKRNDLKAAKAAKQKKIAIGGGVLFVALLAFSVPKTLKMLHHHGPQASSAASRSHTATAAATTATPAVPVANASAGPTVLTAQLAPAAREGQLPVLSASFKSKDPFKQLIPDDTVTSSSAPTLATKKPEKPVGNLLKVVPSTTPTAAAANAPAVRKIAQPFLSAVISVNGVRMGVNVKLNFPAGSPVFHLVSLTKKTAKISVAGGSLASGKPTLTLRRGKALTLVNTADGTRYRLVLLKTSREAVTALAHAGTTTEAGTAPAPEAATAETATTETSTTPTIGG